MSGVCANFAGLIGKKLHLVNEKQNFEYLVCSEHISTRCHFDGRRRTVQIPSRHNLEHRRFQRSPVTSTFLCAYQQKLLSRYNGNRKRFATEVFWWATFFDFKTVIRACTNCLFAVGGGRFRVGTVSLSVALHELLYIDYIEISAAASGERYVLILRDDRWDYCWLFPFPNTVAENVAQEIRDWNNNFGILLGFM